MNRLFRYRCINDLLFKELMYNEIYLASTNEINDPLDLNAVIDFYPRSDEEIYSLIKYLSFLSFRLNPNKNNLNALIDNSVMKKTYEQLEKGLRNKKSKLITFEELQVKLKKIYQSNSKDFSFLENSDGIINNMLEDINIFISNSFVSSFSETNDNFLMWSHYANKHTGICLEFEVKEKSANSCDIPIQVLLPSKDNIDTYQKVIYYQEILKVSYDKQPSINFYDFLPVFSNRGDVDLMNLSKTYWHHYADELKKAYSHKTKAWQYEKEWRLIDIKFNDNALLENRILHYDPIILTSIYFGARTTYDIQKRIMNIINNQRTSGIKYYKSYFDSKSKIKIESIVEEKY